jgi:hypothetical protein
MGWQEAVAAHKRSGNVNNINAENLVARRVLRGLGLSEAKLFKAEWRLGITDAENDTLWQRTRRVLERAVPYHASNIPQWYWHTVAPKADIHTVKTHKEAVDIISEHAHKGEGVLLLTVMEKAKASYAYVLRHPGADIVGNFTPPFTVVGKVDKLWIICQETEQHVAQFGPYPDLYRGDEE